MRLLRTDCCTVKGPVPSRGEDGRALLRCRCDPMRPTERAPSQQQSGAIPLALGLLAAHCIVIYTGFAYFFPLAPRYGQRLADVRSFAPSMTAGLLYAAALTLVFACSALAYRAIRGGRVRAGLIQVLLWAGLMGLPLLAVYPINANDVFRYYLRGDITYSLDGNPFVDAPADFPDQPYHHLAGEWAKKTSPYGPMWEIAAATAVAIGKGDLLTAVVAFKVIGLACHLGCAALLYLLLGGSEQRSRVALTLLWAWNPAALLMFVVDAHNDALMIFWLLLGAWALRVRRQPVVAAVALALAVTTKMSAALAVPFLAAGYARDLELRTWRRGAALPVLAFAATAVLSFLPFADAGLAPVMRVLDESQSGTSFSPLAVVRYLDQTLDWFDPNMGSVVRGASAIFAIAAIVLLIATGRGRSAPGGIADSFLLYLYTAGRFRIWYPLWAFPWALIDDAPSAWCRFRRVFAWTMLWTSQVSVVLYGHMYAFWLGRSRAAAHFIGVAWTFGLPLLVAFLATRERRKRELSAAEGRRRRPSAPAS